MNNELLTILQYIEQERGISRAMLVKALETAILSASRKSIHPASNLTVRIDPENGSIKAWAKLEVVEENPNCDQLLLERARERFPEVRAGEVIDWEVTPRNFGRIAAQTAKQAIMQQLRQAEKNTVQEMFADKVGQIITGTVRRFENGNTIIDFQRAEGIMSSRDRVHGEQYMPGDIINVVLTKIDTFTSGPSLIVSRTAPELVRCLFEREVSEIRNGLVEIMGLSREPGSRSKIAVRSTDPRIDPVGACVGVRGVRVQNITQELNGERIDIVPWDENIAQYTINALQPAKVQSVEVDETRHELVVHVTEDQSKLAFGKKAQNVRLCSRLIGWNISILIEGGIEEKINRAALTLASQLKVSTKTADKLVRSGYVTLAGVEAAEPAMLLNIEGIDQQELNAALARLHE
ncbi:MAG: transcription termination factor NusA [Lentisphaeria bacterium]|nr:transcription termination factor NusA [Lentisphaeria bacterium]